MLKFGIVIEPELEIIMQQKGANIVQWYLDDAHRHQEWKRREQKKKNLLEEIKRTERNLKLYKKNSMSIEVITSVNTLMKKAAAVGKAKRNGNPEEIKKAKKELKAYEQLVLKSDTIAFNTTCSLL